MKNLYAPIGLMTIAAACGCGRTTDLGSDLDTGSGGNGTGASGGTGSGASAGAGGGEEALGTRFWEDTESNAACPTAGRPDKSQRPAETGGADIAPIYVATESIDLGGGSDPDPSNIDDQRWKELGFNLDRSCNAASWPAGALVGEQPQACPSLKQKACTNPFQNVFDGDYCRDNAMGSLFAILSLSPIIGEPFRLTAADFNCAMHRGSMGIVFKISGYNGRANDSSVRVDVYSSTGVLEMANWTCRQGDSSAFPLDTTWTEQAAQPLTKQWQFSQRDIDPAAPPTQDAVPNSKWSDPGAFVRSGWLIAELPPQTELWFNGLNAHTPGIRLVVSNGLLAARLEQDAASDTWSISEGTLGGSIRPGDMITSLREIGYCENLCDSYITTIGYLNQTVDILSNTNDPVPDATCDALSFGMAFTARAITPGPVIAVPPPPDVSGGNCPSARNPDIPKPGCMCPPVGQTGECVE